MWVHEGRTLLKLNHNEVSDDNGCVVETHHGFLSANQVGIADIFGFFGVWLSGAITAMALEQVWDSAEPVNTGINILKLF